MQIKKLTKMFLFGIPLISIIPSSNLITNSKKIIIKNLNSNIEYNFSPIKNFTYVYDNEKINLQFNLQNKFEKASYTLNPMQISIHSSPKSSMNYIANQFWKNINDENINYFITDLKNGEYKKENGQYIPYLSETKKQYKVKVSCGKKHSKISLNCNIQHMHRRGCFKTILYWCTGCLDGFEYAHFNKTYDQINFDKYLKTNSIIQSDFDFSNLLQIDYSKSYKSFDKNVLSFSFNNEYLKSIILGSFNYAYATKFFNENRYIKEEIKHLLSSAIYLNKLIVFDHEIPKFFGYTNNNLDKKHNLRYWVENIENLNYIELKNELNNLDTLSFGKYLNKQNIDINNPYIGKTLFDLFLDENKLKNINFNIDYLLGNDTNIKTISISLLDLLKEKSNKIIYEFKNQINSHLFDNQKISIIGNSISSSNNEIIYVENHKLGINQKNNNGIDELIEISNDKKIIFNEKLNFRNLININTNNNNLESYLKENNIFEKPSKNINENTFRLLTKLNKIISFKDELIQNNIPKEVDSLQNIYFKKYINNYELIPNDLLGSMKVIINFNDSSNIEFNVYGFKKINNNDFQLLKDSINLSKLNINEISLIDKEYIENNLINYSNESKENALFSILLEKNFLKNNIDYSIITNLDYSKNIIINIQYKLNNQNYKLSSKIKNDIKNNNTSNKKTILSIVISFLITIFLAVILTYIYIFLKKKKNKKIN